MKIVYKESFISRFENQLEYISLDSPSRARKFKDELLKRIAKAKRNPMQFRKSVYFDDPNIRDFIFKGYTIVFRINQDTIEVFGFLKFQKFPT
jgi:plasmid stabilization system protein ParE